MQIYLDLVCVDFRIDNGFSDATGEQFAEVNVLQCFYDSAQLMMIGRVFAMVDDSES